MPQASNSADSSSEEIARPISSRVASIFTLGCKLAQWPERFKMACNVPISRLTVFGAASLSIRFC
jgi:predicted RNase H-like nuclease